jgi:hypothetical protein
MDNSNSQLRGWFYIPQGHLAVSEDIFHCHNEELGATGRSEQGYYKTFHNVQISPSPSIKTAILPQISTVHCWKAWLHNKISNYAYSPGKVLKSNIFEEYFSSTCNA